MLTWHACREARVVLRADNVGLQPHTQRRTGVEGLQLGLKLHLRHKATNVREILKCLCPSDSEEDSLLLGGLQIRTRAKLPEHCEYGPVRGVISILVRRLLQIFRCRRSRR